MIASQTDGSKKDQQMGNRNTNFGLFLCECLVTWRPFISFIECLERKRHFLFSCLTLKCCQPLCPHTFGRIVSIVSHDVCLQVSIIVIVVPEAFGFHPLSVTLLKGRSAVFHFNPSNCSSDVTGWRSEVTNPKKSNTTELCQH